MGRSVRITSGPEGPTQRYRAVGDRITGHACPNPIGRDYTNGSFNNFVQNSIGIDPYTLHDGSKAQVLRHLWSTLPDPEFARLTIDMLEYRHLAEDLGHYAPGPADRAATDRRLSEEVIEQLRPLLEPTERLTREEAAFLAKGVGAIDVSNADVSVDCQSVIADRLEEIERRGRSSRFLLAHGPISISFVDPELVIPPRTQDADLAISTAIPSS